MWISKEKNFKGVDKMFNPSQILDEIKYITETRNEDF